MLTVVFLLLLACVRVLQAAEVYAASVKYFSAWRDKLQSRKRMDEVRMTRSNQHSGMDRCTLHCASWLTASICVSAVTAEMEIGKFVQRAEIVENKTRALEDSGRKNYDSHALQQQQQTVARNAALKCVCVCVCV